MKNMVFKVARLCRTQKARRFGGTHPFSGSSSVSIRKFLSGIFRDICMFLPSPDKNQPRNRKKTGKLL
jgi:hypothetical protein